MDANTYSHLASKLINKLDTPLLDQVHMAMGISGEAGEILDEVKKAFAYRRPLKTEHVIEELGDCLFYINGLALMLGTSLEEVMDLNIRKLSTRYPNLQFSTEKANNRNVMAEKAAMTLKEVQ
jgi:NTP pyrophosphatase (non-canonical NTP hydrolase)